jgi:RNA polymerase sigma-B factor
LEPAEEMLARYHETGDRRLRNRVVEDHRWLADAVSRRHRAGAEPLSDLGQVALVGLVKATERFDPAFGVAFTSYAAITMHGELRRHYRDAGWAVRVPRRLQELRYEIRAASEVLSDRLRRSPTTAEVAEYLLVTVDEVIDSLCADSNYRSLSLDTAARRVPCVDDTARGEYHEVESSATFEELIGHLPEGLRRVVVMRYVHEMKQSDIAAELGVSQVQVSRLQRRALELLRPRVAGSAPRGSQEPRLQG